MKKFAKLPIAFGAILALTILLLPSAIAQEGNGGTVNATVSAKVISVSVNPTSVNYGVQSLNAKNLIPSPAFFTATNNGSVPVIMSILGSDTAAWTLADQNGADEYVHRFTLDNPGGSGQDFTTLSSTVAKPVFGINPVGPSSALQIYLNLDMPTSTSAFSEQTASVTVIATEAP